MKFILSTFLILITIKNILSTLQMEIQSSPRCFIEEFYHNSVAVIKYKISNSEGKYLFQDDAAKKGKKTSKI